MYIVWAYLNYLIKNNNTKKNYNLTKFIYTLITHNMITNLNENTKK